MGPNLKAPYETNSFYQNLVVGSGFLPIDPVPYLVRIERSTGGLGVSMNTRNVINQQNVTTNFDLDFALSVREGKFDSHYVSKYDRLSVTVQFNKGSDTMEAPIVRGAAYITTFIKSLTPTFYWPNKIVSVADINNKIINGNSEASQEFLIKTQSKGVWVLYTSSPVKIQVRDLESTKTDPKTGAKTKGSGWTDKATGESPYM